MRKGSKRVVKFDLALSISDIHINPGELIKDICPNLLDMFAQAKAIKRNFGKRVLVLLNGDILNILPLGMKSWRVPKGRKTIESIVLEAPREDFFWLFGNHCGRITWLRELVKPYPWVKIARNLDFEIGDKAYHAEHSHRWTEWFFLRWFADDFTEWITTNPLTRKYWYEFCKRQGWLPGSYPPNPRVDEIVGYHWGNMLRLSVRQGRIWVIGHTHRRVDLLPPDIKGGVIDLGAREEVRIEL